MIRMLNGKMAYLTHLLGRKKTVRDSLSPRRVSSPLSAPSSFPHARKIRGGYTPSPLLPLSLGLLLEFGHVRMPAWGWGGTPWAVKIEIPT